MELTLNDFKRVGLVGTGRPSETIVYDNPDLIHLKCKKSAKGTNLGGFFIHEKQVSWTKEIWRCEQCHMGYAAPLGVILSSGVGLLVDHKI